MRRDTGVGCGGVIAAVCRPIRRFSVVFTSRCRLLPSSRLYLPLRDASLSLFSPPRCARRDAFSARKKNKIPLLSSLLLSSLFHFFLIIFPLSLSLSLSLDQTGLHDGGGGGGRWRASVCMCVCVRERETEAVEEEEEEPPRERSSSPVMLLISGGRGGRASCRGGRYEKRKYERGGGGGGGGGGVLVESSPAEVQTRAGCYY